MALIPVPVKTKPGERLGAIPGVAPSLVGDVRGCTFRDQCAYARPICAEPIDRSMGEAWRVGLLLRWWGDSVARRRRKHSDSSSVLKVAVGCQGGGDALRRTNNGFAPLTF